MKRPTLLAQLMTILDTYPDDAQIIKELIQNAEDANATEMKLLHDQRQINPDGELGQYFKTPALCVYNDTEFTNNDWDGIISIYISAKKNDKLKVGRFGLGFKSVFHLTDHPVIISGDKVLIIDPLQSEEEVCDEMCLQDLEQKYSESICHLNNVFGINKSVAEGNYSGTFFWFPLRDKPSALSDNIYTEQKMTQLLETFKEEAPISILFLKSLLKIETLCRSGTLSEKIQTLHTVFMAGSEKELEKRRVFKNEVLKLNGELPTTSIESIYEVTMATENDSESWVIVNYIQGMAESPEISDLAKDPDLSYSPYVGVAYPCNSDGMAETGHIFCFLPLPLEKDSLTGLPVHVNGLFALEQNRRHMKWGNRDQSQMMISKDKHVLWNEMLIKNVLPKAYEHLVDHLVTKSQELPFQKDTHVVRSIPTQSKTSSNWDMLLQKLIPRLLSKKIFYTENEGGKWISQKDAIFPLFSPVVISDEMEGSITKFVLLAGKNIVPLQYNMKEWIKNEEYNNHSPQGITPELLREVLHSCNEYKTFNQKEKLNLLHYAAVDKTYIKLDGIELLPLSDGTFTTFHLNLIMEEDEQLYLCKNGEETIFLGLENRLVATGDQFPEEINKILQEIAENGLFQLQILTDKDFPYLYQKTVEQRCQRNAENGCFTPMSDSIDLKWLEKVWRYINDHFVDGDLEMLNRLPLLAERNLEKPSLDKLLPLKGFYLVGQCDGMGTLSPQLDNILRLFSITKLQALPDFLKIKMGTFVHYPNQEGLFQLLSEIITEISADEIIDNFNNNSSQSDKAALVEFLSEKTESIPSNLKPLFSDVQMFMVSLDTVGSNDQSPQFVAVSQNNQLVPHSKFPVPYPYKMIVGKTTKVRELALTLGAVEKEVSELVQDVLREIQKDRYSEEEVKTFMDYFLTNISMYGSVILQMAQRVTFIPTSNTALHCAMDLFDPRDEHLKILFYGEDKFPRQPYQSEDTLNALLKLGLKKSKDVTFEDILGTAKILDTINNENICKRKYISKAEKLKYFLNVLNIELGIDQLNELKRLRWVVVAKRPERYPECLPWYSEDNNITLSTPENVISSDFYLLSGSVQSIIDVTETREIIGTFQWDQPPTESVILEQLKCIANSFKPERRPDLLPIVANLYEHLNQLDSGYDCFKDTNCILCENTFKKACEVYINDEEDSQTLNLHPYLHKLPREFLHLDRLFFALGCHEFLTPDIVINVLGKINQKHNNETKVSKSKKNVQSDFRLVIQIVKYLDGLSLPDIKQKNVLLPVKTKEDCILLKYPSECTYIDDDTDWLFAAIEDDIFYVHREIEPMIAIRFGVPSVVNRFLTDDNLKNMVMECGQSEDLTTRLNNILEGYTDGFAIPKEIVQNADDAGATEVAFLYDERENEHARINLIDPNMAECQGPALWAYNNSMFQESDFENIQKLSGRTKEKDKSTVGKFGLGFCSVYNVTDVPSFYSGNTMVIFDPHRNYLGKALKNREKPGLIFQLNQKIMRYLHNQFQPFNGIFDCDLSGNRRQEEYKGTLFRLPLRTKKQAERSKIKATHYSKEEITKLLDIFIRSAGDLLLFTQSIKTIKVYHLSSTSTDPTEKVLLFSADKVNQNTIPKHMNDKHVLKYFLSHQDEELSVVHNFKISVNITANMESLCKRKATSNETSWLVAWGSLVDCSKAVKDGVPIGATAVPVSVKNDKLYLSEIPMLPDGFYKSSHLFCFLPLPVHVNLSFHLNGCFSVERDRKCLTRKSEDDKVSENVEWNNKILSGAVCNSFITLLNTLRELLLETEYDYSHLWPRLSSNEMELAKFFKSFYQKIVQGDYQVFCQDGRWYSFKECCFLDPSLRFDGEIGDMAFDCLLQFSDDRKVVHIKEDIIECLHAAECTRAFQEKVLHTEMFYNEVFFQNISSEIWLTNQKIKERDKLTMFALKSKNEHLRELVRANECIPTRGKERLRNPAELVHPETLSASLFDDNDERFPTKLFCEIDSLEALSELGMKTDLIPFEWVKERANTIKSLRKDMALKRCKSLLEYLRTFFTEIIQHGYNLSELSNIEFLPIEEKPANWPVTWKGEMSIEGTYKSQSLKEAEKTFACPKQLYFEKYKFLIGSSELIMSALDHHNVYDKYAGILKAVGVHNVITVEAVLKQLEIVGECTIGDMEAAEKEGLKKICFEIYKYMNENRKHQHNMTGETETKLKDLNSKSIILTSDTEGEENLIKPSQMAFNRPLNSNITYDCRPYLYFVDQSLKKYEEFLKLVGVEDTFSSTSILCTINECKKNLGVEPCSEKEAMLVLSIIKLLNDTCKQEKLPLSDDQIKNLIVPDEKCVLRSPCDLCFDDEYEELEKKSFMQFVHSSADLSLLKMLQIKSKRVEHLKRFAGAMHFGQKESLVTRLKGLLKEYPFDSTILHELLQNADDAHATEIHFILDERTHPNSGIFEDSWIPLQGPSLLVYNDKFFTESDIQGIQNLGIGTKSDDPTKTGQFGLGFNATYCLTDVPSFLTRCPDTPNGGTLCIFDPHCNYAPLATPEHPGIRLNDLSEIQNHYPGVYNTYLQQELPSKIGTWFRFPLRNKEMSEKSAISNKVVTVNDINNLYKSFQKDMQIALLFVSNVHEIKLSRISNTYTNLRRPLYRVKASLSDHDKETRASFNQYVKQSMEKLKATKCSLAEIPFKEAVYRVEIENSFKQRTNWLVVQRFGISENTAEMLINAVADGEIGLTPRGGIALPVISETYLQSLAKKTKSKTKTKSKAKRKKKVSTPVYSLNIHKKMLKSLNFPKKINKDDQRREVIGVEMKTDQCEKKINEQSEIGDFKVFCFLPTPIRSGLPGHINGHFALDPGRRNMFRDGDIQTVRGEWNSMILNDIIPKAYIRGMEVLRDYLMDFVHKQLISPYNAIEIFHLVFPNQTDIQEKCFASLVNRVYQNIWEGKIAVFPIQNYLSTTLCKVPKTITWVPLFENDQILQAYFNDLHIQFIKVVDQRYKRRTILNEKTIETCKKHDMELAKEDSTNLSRLLKSIGLKLIESPLWVLDAIQKASITGECVSPCSPGVVTQFIKSQSGSSPEQCRTFDVLKSGATEAVLKKVKLLLSYCLKSSSFLENMENLPLLVTEDNELRYFSSSRPVYVSSFCKLLPKSKEKIANAYLFDLLDELPCKSLQILDIQSFASLLPMSIDESVYKNKNGICLNQMQEKDNIPNQEWLELFWKYLSRQKYQRNFQEVCQTDMKDWCFIPGEAHGKSILVSFEYGHRLLDLSSFTEPTRKEAFASLQLPKPHLLKSASTIKDFLANERNALSVLNCLYYSVEHLRSLDISDDSCDEILKYLFGNINTEEDHTKMKLKKLPLYNFISGTRNCLDSGNKMLILSTDIPIDGLDTWSQKAGLLLLKSHFKNDHFLLTLGAQQCDAVQFYGSHLLPNFDLLEKTFIMTHLTYIRDEIIPGNTKEKCREIRKQLKLIKFITLSDGDNVLVKADRFYCPFNEIFKIMWPERKFPPQPFNRWKWRAFMDIAGMKSEITEDLFIQFANEIENAGINNGITEAIEEQSKKLVLHLFTERQRQQFEYSSLLKRIKHIRFLVPHETSKVYSDIYPVVKHSQLICFSKSISHTYIDTSWTVCPLLPQYADPKPHILNTELEQMEKYLDIYTKPEVEIVIRHAKNICPALKKKCHTNYHRGTNLEPDRMTMHKIMKEIYTFLDENGKQTRTKDELLETPIIHVYDYDLFCTPEQIILDISSDDEIIPYLFKAPTKYGYFQELFRFLGSKDKLTCQHYANVLTELKRVVMENNLSPKDLSITKKAVFGFFTEAQKDHNQLRSIKCLYLPSENNKLYKAQSLIHCNKKSWKPRLTQLNIQYLHKMDFANQGFNVEIIISKLPNQIRPKVLTELVKEELVPVPMNDIIYDSEDVAAIESFIGSSQFIKVVCYLIHHDNKKSADRIKDGKLAEILQNIQSIEFMTVRNLRTWLRYDEEIVNGSEEQVQCYYAKIDGSYKFYFKEDTGDVSKRIRSNLTRLILECTESLIYDKSSFICLSEVVGFVPDIHCIEPYLEDHDINIDDKFENIEDEWLPPLGSLVPEDEYVLLDNSFTEFRTGEYVAYEIYDPEIDDLDTQTMVTTDLNNPVYIYVKVIGKCSSAVNGEEINPYLLKYEVNMGHGIKESVHVIRMYKFVHKISTDIVEYTGKQSRYTEAREDEVMKGIRKTLIQAWKLCDEKDRKRVIKRLYLSWHPDKNIGNEEFCTKVIQYIQEIIRQLENGEINLDSGDGPSYSNWNFTRHSSTTHTGTWYSAFGERVNSRYHSSWTDYQSHQQQRRGLRRPNPQEPEARRWLKQAKDDLAVAVGILNCRCKDPINADTYNWVCYISHQAAEKAIVAITYSTDANKVKKTHRLLDAASAQPKETLRMKAATLDTFLGNYNQMRYPYVNNFPYTPSQLYNVDRAKEAIRQAQEIVTEVSEYLL